MADGSSRAACAGSPGRQAEDPPRERGPQNLPGIGRLCDARHPVEMSTGLVDRPQNRRPFRMLQCVRAQEIEVVADRFGLNLERQMTERKEARCDSSSLRGHL